jgi:dimethylargininase
VLMFKDVAIVALPGADQRKPEAAEVASLVQSLGYRIERIEHPATFDGGDALKVGSTIYVGLSGRTNAAGIEQLRAILSPLGANVIAVPLTKVLHLKSAITALPDETIVGWLPAVDDVDMFPTFVATPEESGAHVVLIGGNKLLMSSGCPQTAAMFRKMGYEPVEVDIDEFIKLEGCVTCLSVRLREFP